MRRLQAFVQPELLKPQNSSVVRPRLHYSKLAFLSKSRMGPMAALSIIWMKTIKAKLIKISSDCLIGRVADFQFG